MITTYDRRGQLRTWGGADAKLVRRADGTIGVFSPTGTLLGTLARDDASTDSTEQHQQMPGIGALLWPVCILALAAFGITCWNAGVAHALNP